MSLKPHNPHNFPARTTTVANFRQADGLVVDSADKRGRLPPTRPFNPALSRPPGVTADHLGPTRKPTMREDFEARNAERAKQPPIDPAKIRLQDRVQQPGKGNNWNDPPEGIGVGEPPRGGVKVR